MSDTYDDEALEMMVKHGASGAIVILFGGEKGTGFSFRAIRQEMAEMVPSVLREVANEIEGETAVKPS